MAEHENQTYTETVSNLRGDMREGFAELKGEISSLRQSIDAGNTARITETFELRKDVDDHETRIRSVEQRKTVAPMTLWGIVLGFASFVTAAASVVINAIK